MMNAETGAVIDRVAAVFGYQPAALKAVVEVESAGQIFAIVDGRHEPLIRWEGHYFYRRCVAMVRERAEARHLAAPAAGAIKNPASQQARWDDLLKPASQLDRQAALESCSWGVGQVMGAHWKWLDYSSVLEMVDRSRADLEGQLELMCRFIEKSGLKGALARQDWKTFAAGYNGPAFMKYGYHTRLAAAYARHDGQMRPVAGRDGRVLEIQSRLNAHGFIVTVDGWRGRKTTSAIKAFQKARGLLADGIVGSLTAAALAASPPVKS